MDRWTNERAIEQWGKMPREALDAMEPDGDFSKKHLLNPVLLRMLGDVRGRRVLDAGCGHGYLSRMLAARGAGVVGVEPARSLYEYAAGKERELHQGIRYVRADLSRLPDLDGPFDAVVASMVLHSIPEWERALASCVQSLREGGLLVFSVNHPCFDPSPMMSWREKGCVEVREYLREYEMPGPSATDFHRTLSTYVNAVVAAGCHVREVAEPGLAPELVASGAPGVEAYVHVPNFIVVAAERAGAA